MRNGIISDTQIRAFRFSEPNRPRLIANDIDDLSVYKDKADP